MIYLGDSASIVECDELEAVFAPVCCPVEDPAFEPFCTSLFDRSHDRSTGMVEMHEPWIGAYGAVGAPQQIESAAPSSSSSAAASPSIVPSTGPKASSFPSQTPTSNLIFTQNSSQPSKSIFVSSTSSSECVDHKKCNESGLYGLCCPTADGVDLECCGKAGLVVKNGIQREYHTQEAACSAHEKCAGLSNDCCPNVEGLFLDCCSN